MKRFFLIGLISTINIFIFAQSNNSLVVGIKNNQFPLINYSFKDTWNIGLMSSFFIREASSQYVKAFGGYNLFLQKIKTNFTLLPYVGVNYGGAFFDTGLGIRLNKFWFNDIETTIQTTPYYDSSYGFHCSYSAILGYKLNNNIQLTMKITDYPEFRIVENRMTFAVFINMLSLVVKPELSVPINSDIRTSRLQLSFLYNLLNVSESTIQRKNILY